MPEDVGFTNFRPKSKEDPMAEQKKRKKSNFRPKSKGQSKIQNTSSSSSLAEILGNDLSTKLRDMAENNIKNMVKSARTNPKVLEAEKKLADN